MAWTIGALDRNELELARALLARACHFDRADVVAEEKLFGDAPAGQAQPIAVRTDDELLGVAVVSGRWIRLLAIDPAARARGIGSALLESCEALMHAAGHAAVTAMAQPGNYPAPGIDVRNSDTIAWLERRGWKRRDRDAFNLLVDVRGNPRASRAHADALAARADYQIRRARPDEAAWLTAAIDAEFGMAWPFEVARAIVHGGVHIALDGDGAPAAFAAHDGNNQGLGWFGPAGTWPAHRKRGLGEALLAACLADIAVDHEVCEVAWVGPREFYERAVGVTGERRFAWMTKELKTT